MVNYCKILIIHSLNNLFEILPLPIWCIFEGVEVFRGI